VYADDLLRPWYEIAVAQVPGIEVVDVHTHLGQNDPDGFTCSPPELLEALGQADARGVVFPMAEPSGYPEANDAVMAHAAAASDRLTAFCRVDPNTGPAAVAEARRCLDAGAAGIKLHPRAEGFTLDHPEVLALSALAHERRAPIIVHAGRGIPALGRHAVALAREHPEARIILAHVGLSDLGWIWKPARELPNLYFDTSWWNPADLLVLFGLVPPGQILFGSDVPYGTTLHGIAGSMRCALQVGLGEEQLRGIAGAQTERLLAGEEPLDLGPAPGLDAISHDPLLDRVQTYLTASLPLIMRGGDPTELLALARLACDVDVDAPHPAAYRSILALLDRREQIAADEERPERERRGGHLVVTAGIVARTPDVPLPPGPDAEAPAPPR
jgi:predicted TIM-barrel fold metal-dependent hydrolase